MVEPSSLAADSVNDARRFATGRRKSARGRIMRRRQGGDDGAERTASDHRHDGNGKAVVKIDEVAKHVTSGRPGATSVNIWTTEGFPANNDGNADEGLRKVATTLANGTIFRIIEFAPGLAARNHRTDSIDYIVVISGEIEMELDDTLVRLKAGDAMVQRGTIHNWVNRGSAPCVLAVILVDAKSVEAGGKVLAAQG
jgi:quercetin dioxygenase-like cupin family protein